MASVVQLCNMALSHIGSEARVASITPPDGSVEAGYCATFFDMARTEMLEPGTWAFSLKRAALAQVDNESTAWAYAYALPSDCLRALRLPASRLPSTVFTQDTVVIEPHDQSSRAFDIEGAVLRTNEPDAVLLYVRDVTDSGQFTPSFTSALSYLLASYLAGPIIKGDTGAKAAAELRKVALSLSTQAATSDATQKLEVTRVTPVWIRERG